MRPSLACSCLFGLFLRDVRAAEPPVFASSADADATYVGFANGSIGAALAVADVDCDGVADLLTANPDFGDYSRGEAYVVPGPLSGVVRQRDLVVLRNPEKKENAWFGDSLTGGDADGDGCADVLVDLPAAQNERGSGQPAEGVELPVPRSGHGRPDQVGRRRRGHDIHGRLLEPGIALAISPDLDGDATPDLIVNRSTDGDAGVVYVTSGMASGTSRVEATAAYVLEDVGGVMAVDDLDSDGIDDLVLTGRDDHIYVVEGGRRAGTYVVPDVAVSAIGNGSSGNLYGSALATADYDGDGAVDVFVGEPGGYASMGGRGGVVYGYLGPLPAFADNGDVFVRWESEDSADGLTENGALATGDVDADGQPDVAMGSRSTPTTGDGTGRVYVQVGAASGVIDVSSLLSIAAVEPARWFGDTVAFVPDWDGDGGDELAIGAPAHANPVGYGGALFVFSSDQLD